MAQRWLIWKRCRRFFCRFRTRISKSTCRRCISNTRGREWTTLRIQTSEGSIPSAQSLVHYFSGMQDWVTYMWVRKQRNTSKNKQTKKKKKQITNFSRTCFQAFRRTEMPGAMQPRTAPWKSPSWRIPTTCQPSRRKSTQTTTKLSSTETNLVRT